MVQTLKHTSFQCNSQYLEFRKLSIATCSFQGSKKIHPKKIFSIKQPPNAVCFLARIPLHSRCKFYSILYILPPALITMTDREVFRKYIFIELIKFKNVLFPEICSEEANYWILLFINLYLILRICGMKKGKLEKKKKASLHKTVLNASLFTSFNFKRLKTEFDPESAHVPKERNTLNQSCYSAVCLNYNIATSA